MQSDQLFFGNQSRPFTREENLMNWCLASARAQTKSIAAGFGVQSISHAAHA